MEDFDGPDVGTNKSHFEELKEKRYASVEPFQKRKEIPNYMRPNQASLNKDKNF
jgi:hypothetical protein